MSTVNVKSQVQNAKRREGQKDKRLNHANGDREGRVQETQSSAKKSARQTPKELVEHLRMQRVLKTQQNDRYPEDETPDSPKSMVNNSFMSNQHQMQIEAEYSEAQALIDEALKVSYIPVDLALITNQWTSKKLGGSAELRQDSDFNWDLKEFKNKLMKLEEERLNKELARKLSALLYSLDFNAPDELVASCSTMEELAVHIKAHLHSQFLKQEKKPVLFEASVQPETHDEHNSENKRLKELIVKLQYEISENFKKTQGERIKELFEENQNLSRKVADLIDQLKRKEQEVLLINLGAEAERRLLLQKQEKEQLLRRMEEERASFELEIKSLEERLRSQRGQKSTRIIENHRGTAHFDLNLLAMVREDKAVIQRQNEMLGELRKEAEGLREAARRMGSERADLEKEINYLSNWMNLNGVDVEAMLDDLRDEASQEDVDQDPNLQQMFQLKEELNLLKQEVHQQRVLDK
jgi:hypothetical protein